jgi:DNA-binding MarR family transcriptional regulator
MLNQGLQLGEVLAFLSVAIKEGQSVSDIQKRIGLEQSTASRYLSELKEYSYKREGGKRLPGMNLVEDREDFNDSRSVRKQYLTRKGIHTIETILTKLRSNEQE